MENHLQNKNFNQGQARGSSNQPTVIPTANNTKPPQLPAKQVPQEEQLNPQMMKALKLFAKNHQELEKVSDPEKGVNRRVLSYDSRSNQNVPASTFEKCGGTVPSGPKFVNELVEKELSNYKQEVEVKFKTSIMNNNYVFLRRNNYLHGGKPKVKQVSLNESDDEEITVDLQCQQQFASKTVDSRLQQNYSKMDKKREQYVVDERLEEDEEEHVLFTRSNHQNLVPDIQNQAQTLIVESIRGEKAKTKAEQASSKELLIDIEEDEEQLFELIKSDLEAESQNQVGPNKLTLIPGPRGQQPVIQINNNFSKTPVLVSSQTKIKTLPHSPKQSHNYQPPKSNYQQFITAAAAKKQDQPNGPHHQKTFTEGNNSSQGDSSMFFNGINTAFNKTDLPNKAPPAMNTSGQSQQQQQHPIVIQFQNKKITFKNHHHYHHHHHHHLPTSSESFVQSNGDNHPSQSRQSQAKMSPAAQQNLNKSPKGTSHNAIPSKKPSNMVNSHIVDDTIPNPSGQVISKLQTVTKMTPNQLKLAQQVKKPPTQQQPQASNFISKPSKDIVVGINNHNVVKPPSSNIVGTPLQQQQLQRKGKKNQVNQILQQILSYEPQKGIITTPPSPKTIEFSTQQIQNNLSKDQQQNSTSNSLGRPRQSGGVPLFHGENQQTLVLEIPKNISSNFGLSKTQDSKKPPSNSNNTSQNNTSHLGGNTTINEMTIMEFIKNHSNENIGILGAPRQSGDNQYLQSNIVLSNPGNVLTNNSSFNSNFRTQIPTGTKLIIQGQPQLQVQERKKQHTRYKTGVDSPSNSKAYVLGASLTMDNSRKQTPLSRSKAPQKIPSSQGIRVQGTANSSSLNPRLITSNQMDRSVLLQQPSIQGQKQKALKKKKVSIGSGGQQSLRNSVGQHTISQRQQVKSSHQPILQHHHQQDLKQLQQQFFSSGHSKQHHQIELSSQVKQQQSQSSRLIKKNPPPSSASAAHNNQNSTNTHQTLSNERQLSHLKEQLMKAAYKTSFNSPNRLSQPHQAPIPLISAAPGQGGGALQYYQSQLDERGKKRMMVQAHSTKQASSLSGTRKSNNISRGP